MIAAKEELNVEVCAMFKYYIQIFKDTSVKDTNITNLRALCIV